MRKPKVDKNVYTGLCVGGPMAGQVLNSVGDRNYPVAKMMRVMPPLSTSDVADEWSEVRRGLYQHDVGIWWWRGWERKKQLEGK
jgi:hypothetical protein